MKKQTMKDLLSFLSDSPTAFHACRNITEQLKKADFIEIKEKDEWSLTPKGKYFVTRNDSSVIAFQLGNKIHSPMTMMGAHTDSPCLKPKPNALFEESGYLQCGIEIYGGALLNPWFDRDLALAGKVLYKDKHGKLAKCFIDTKKPIAIIPSLAIHLDSKANRDRTVNAQLHIPPLLGTEDCNKDFSFKPFLAHLVEAQENVKNIEVLDHELNFYDTQPAAMIGLSDDLLASARLDNLLSCFCGLQAMMEDSDQPMLLVCTDHEEVGSGSYCGAQGPFLEDVIDRIVDSSFQKSHFIRNSIMYSVDNAHAIHPNYTSKHEPEHAPVFNRGIVIKHNAKQKYATNSESAAITRQICLDNKLKVQDMVVRSDMRCGSTIGPITSTEIGIVTVDIGIPQLAMHSVRELAHINDISDMIGFLRLARENSLSLFNQL